MNEEAKRQTLRLIPYGLYVVGLKDGPSFHAFTGSWLSQCSLKPPRVMLGVRNGTHSLRLIQDGGFFSVNFLPKSDKMVLERFFKPAPVDGNRFGDVAFRTGRTGTPILERATHCLECELKAVSDAGDHSIVVGEVVEAHVFKDDKPLVMGDTPWHYGG